MWVTKPDGAVPFPEYDDGNRYKIGVRKHPGDKADCPLLETLEARI
jgi:hypothetical protein